MTALITEDTGTLLCSYDSDTWSIGYGPSVWIKLWL